MTNDRTVSCLRRSMPGVSLLLFGLAAAAACSGTDDPASATGGADAGAAPAPQGDSVEIAKNLAVDQPALAHLSVDRASALRLHESKVLRLTREEGPGPVLDAEIAATAAGTTEVWAIEDRQIALAMRPAYANDVTAEATEDGRVVYRDAFGSADLIQSLDERALHQTIVLEDGNAMNYLRWDLETGTTELRPIVLDDGTIVLVDGENAGRLKVSAVTLVDASGEVRRIPITVRGSEAGLYISRRDLSYPAVADFSIAAPMPGEQFAVSPVQIKGRMLVLLDTSGSMIWGFNNETTQGGDGSPNSVYCDNDLGSGFGFNCSQGAACTLANGGRNYYPTANVNTPSRIYAAKEAITNVVTAHAGLLDFGLERFAYANNCQNGEYCCNPASTTNTSDRGRCQDSNAFNNATRYFDSLPGDPDITSLGGCGVTGDGGVILVQPSATSAPEVLSWVDHVENFCETSPGSGVPVDPELRVGGGTPVRRSIQTAIDEWYRPIYQVSKASPNPAHPLYDPLIDCRPYVLVFMSDGQESGGSCIQQQCDSDSDCLSNDCDGDGICDCANNSQCPSGFSCVSGECQESLDPSGHVGVLTAINAANPVQTYAMGMGDPSGSALDIAELNQIMVAGGSGLTTAPVAQNQVEIEAAFADIVSRTVKFEVCNDADDNCNTLIDEGLGVYQECAVNGDCGSGTCNQGRCTCSNSNQCASNFACSSGFCRPACAVGVGQCRNTGVRKCGSSGNSTCCEDDGLLTCTPLQPLPPGQEVCNGLDDDCNGIIDDVPGGCQGCNPLPEVCNGVDDDCDGTPDDNPVDVGQPCGSSEGVCMPGTTACINGTLTCQGGNTGGPEVCNGLDDNCDSVIDGVTRSCYTGPGGTLNVGICRGGSQNCTAVPGSGTPSWGTCVGQVTPATETCNGLDDNCNNVVDDVPGVGTSCCPSGLCGTGICQAGTRQCSGGTLQCIGAIGPGTEVCNGIDDDCNGTVDDVAGVGSSCCPSGNCGTGACQAGNLACVGNQLVCQGALGPSPEVCDGVDNDCNGSVDDLAGAGQACCPAGISCGVGICTDGSLQCVTGSSTLQCTGATGPATEVCNSLDDNCNGVVDDVPGSGESCCSSGLCGAGICTNGVRQCVGTTLTCVNEVLPQAEICDSLDNNCNGTVDDVPGVGGTCCRFQNSSGQNLCGTGICSGGTLQCQSNSPTPVCVGGTGPANEVCNGLDDDCDGVVDDLPGGTVGAPCCASGRCGVGVCTGGTLQCGPNGLVCQGGTNPSTEVCDNLDNDCNGTVDDVPGAGQNCCPPGVACGTGICTGGTLQCAPGAQNLQCIGARGPETEVCDGLDNDCNGLVDDVTGSGSSCCTSGQCGVGVCTEGVRRCEGTTLTCVGEVLPGTEICDNKDNDCNGTTDDVPNRGTSCCPFTDSQGNDLCGVGICTNGTRECVPGQTTLRCTGGTGPGTELCDGVDNDCNGIVDDLPGGTVGGTCCPSGKCGIGVCRPGQLACGPRGVECTGAVNPSGEVCDNLDNDCNGEVDDVPGLGTVCCPSGLCGQGICRSGTLQCGANGLECGGGVGPETEVCDGLDNDCNGIVDDIPRVLCCAPGSPPGDPPGACNKGICRPGLTACDPQTGETICEGAIGPEDEVCDGSDNDCDGTIDDADEVAENDPEIGVACMAPTPPQDHPPCKPGETICQGGHPVCTGAVGPREEVCDGQDNDCDGVADQGDLCGDTRACIVGVCRSPCVSGEFGSCPGGLVCRVFDAEGRTTGYCVPRDSGGGSGGAGSGTGGTSGGGGITGGGGDSGDGGQGQGGGVGADGGLGDGGTTGGGGFGGLGPDGGVLTGGAAGSGAGNGGTGTSGTGSGAAGGIGQGAGGDEAGKHDVYGLATGGGGCSCRVAERSTSPAGAAAGLLLALGLVLRRRDRRAA